MSREKIENYDDQLLTPAESIVVASHTLCTVNNDIMTNVSFDSEQMELHLQRL